MMLVLASQSPRRKEILAAAGFRFTTRAPNIPEQRQPGEAARDYVVRLAQEKAEAVGCSGDEVVLAADTVVVAGTDVLEKPEGPGDASRMLRLLAGREHQVITGVCLRTQTRKIVDYAITNVVMSPLTEAEIAFYVASGEPLDKAGAYAIQGIASRFISRIEGCYFNVVGLPIALVYRHLCEMGAVLEGPA
jgi:septum formation protein